MGNSPLLRSQERGQVGLGAKERSRNFILKAYCVPGLGWILGTPRQAHVHPPWFRGRGSLERGQGLLQKTPKVQISVL